MLTLSRDMADRVARHLVAAGQVIDEDPDMALQHAIAARRIASRVAVVREAVGLAAYAAGDWATAIAELRTYHRMSGKQTHLAEIADSERALGRPERAIDLYRGADREALDNAGAIELLIVAAGARGDLGQHDAAVAMLQVRELTTDEDAEWAARLRYAYADALLAAGRREEAREWFSRAAAADPEDLTDANERMLELDGVVLEDDDDVEDESAVGDGAGEDIAGERIAVGDGAGEDIAGQQAAVGDDAGEDTAGDERDQARFQADADVDENEADEDEADEDEAYEDEAEEITPDSLENAADAGPDVEEKAAGDEFVAAAEDEPLEAGKPDGVQPERRPEG